MDNCGGHNETPESVAAFDRLNAIIRKLPQWVLPMKRSAAHQHIEPCSATKINFSPHQVKKLFQLVTKMKMLGLWNQLQRFINGLFKYTTTKILLLGFYGAILNNR